MIEIEVRARYDDFEKIRHNLKKIGAKFLDSEDQADKVFENPKFIDEQHFMKEGGIVGRIRVSHGKIALEFKEIIRGSGGIEVSSEIKNIEIGIHLLNKLGYAEAFTVSKHRENYAYKDFTISLDKVEKLGNFVEVEKMVNNPEEKSSARQECDDLLFIIAPGAVIENQKYGDMMQKLINDEEAKAHPHKHR